MEQSRRLGTLQQINNRSTSRRLSPNHHVVRVSTESSNVLFDPFQHGNLVCEGIVARDDTIVQSEESKDVETVVKVDDDNITAGRDGASVKGGIIPNTADVTTSKDPEENGFELRGIGCF